MRILMWFATVATCIAFGAAAPAQPPAAQTQKGPTIRGRVVRVQGTDRFVVRTADRCEVILVTNPQTKFLLNNRPARFTDLREGVEITTIYEVTGDQNIASSVTLAAVQEPPATQEVTVVEGTVVRIIEPDQIVVRSAAGKEVILFTEQQTTFTLNNKPAKLVDIRPGASVKINFDVRNQKHMARTVVVTPGRSK